MQPSRLISSLFRFGRERGGNASAEFALALPLLMIFTFGTVEVGRMLHDLHVVKESVRDAARYLSRVPATCSGGAGTFANANDVTVGKALAMTGVASASPPAGSNLLGYWDFSTQQSSIQVTINCVANNGKFQGYYLGDPEVPVITMQADVPFSFLFGQLVMSGSSITFDVQHTVVNAPS